MANRSQCSKCIPLAGVVALGLEEGKDEIRSIRDQNFVMLEYRLNSENSVLSNVSVSML